MLSIPLRLCLLVLVFVSMVDAARAVYDPVLEDGFECRTWYTDADADGFGAPHSGVFSCVAPAGHVARADDCDDGAANVNPLAADRPDIDYVDANCDGSDGDAGRAIHVAMGEADTPTCGPRVSPCRTIAYAIGRRTADRPDIYIREGTYTGPITVPSLSGATSSGLFGGFDAQWVRRPGVVSRIMGGALTTLDGGTGGVSVAAATVVLGDLEIEAPNAFGTTDSGSGRSSVGVVARNANLTVWGCRIRAGRGSNGVNGSPGNAFLGTAPSGSAGGNGISRSSCNTAPGGAGGAGATNDACAGSTGGGAGGRGGAADTDCGLFTLNPTALPGSPGADAQRVMGSFGLGGSGGTGGFSCGLAAAGESGIPGTAGNGGSGGNGGSVVSGNWVGTAGQSGGVGSAGGGGGGGGGSGGCDSFNNTAGAGGGGGGAGGCAAPAPGTGGRAGGASIAVLLTSSSATVSASTLITVGGGAGGGGGAGARGQDGGPGGTGGAAAPPSLRAGAAGGAGGDGGASGGGGGGAGGPSVGILRRNSTVATSGLLFQLGAGGAGGAGGAAAQGGNAGQPGSPGATVQIFND